MPGFAPSASAAAAALAGKNVIVQKVHPGGKAGVKFSLAEVAARTKEGRNDPRIKGWTGRALIAAGKPKGVRAQAQAILNAFRAATMYTPDPVQTELITKPAATLCLDEHGLCMPAGDCDCRVVCVGSCLLSIGIDVRIIGQAFNYDPVESHVILAAIDETGQKLKIDPSHDNWPVGQAANATKETVIDPMTSTSTGLAGTADTPGDFIGIGSLPAQLAPNLGPSWQPVPWMDLSVAHLPRTQVTGLAPDAWVQVGSIGAVVSPTGQVLWVYRWSSTGRSAGRLGQTPPATYVLGKNTIPLAAPVGSIVQEQPGSPYVTTCTKQADSSWTCTNGSTFAPGQLEHLASVTCPAGSTFVSPGLCVPPGGLKLASGSVLMPDGSYHTPDGAVLAADGTLTEPNGTVVAPGGQVSFSTSAYLTMAMESAQQMVMHPLDTMAAGAAVIGNGAGTIVGNAGAGFANGLTNPTTPGGETFVWLGALAAAIAGIYILAPVVKEVIATRQEGRLDRERARHERARHEPHEPEHTETP